MATKKKLLQAAAGTAAAGGAALNVEDVFSTYLYEGNGSTNTIINGIDLDGEGGLVWIKDRDSSSNSHFLYDTERGVGTAIKTDGTNVAQTRSTGLTAFNSNGFTLGSLNAENSSGNSKVSWTWRKAPRFFDVVTWTGTGSTHSVSHSLDSQIGFMAVKATSYADNWYAFHRQMANPSSYTQPYLRLNADFGVTSLGDFGTSVNLSNTSSFQVSGNINLNGVTYVAYLFAHNNGDGDFGPDADQDAIKCGGITNAASGVNTIDLGFEAQWVMIKRTDSAGDWYMADVMRGAPTLTLSTQRLFANTNSAESADPLVGPHPTGFQFNNQWGTSSDWVYIAIRRGPMAVPESATDVFAVEDITTTSTQATSGFPVDMFISGYSTKYTFDRLRNDETLATNSTAAEFNWGSTAHNDDLMDGVTLGSDMNGYLLWMWRRAPNFFDVVAYTGNGTAGRTVSHNLGVAPEMIWVKDRSSTNEWAVYHSGVDATAPEDYRLYLNDTAARVDTVNFWNDTAPTDSNFTVGNGSRVNANNDTYIAYLFASLDGISKVGSFNPPSSGDLNIDCGFTSGARFVLIKRADFSSAWFVWDTERGIVAGNDPYLALNTTGAEVNTYDAIDPYSAGFSIPSTAFGSIFSSSTSANYIFYAIA